MHPRDPDTNQRDQNFQFYGEAVTAADGSYSFRTIVPGRYEPRPQHIHVKVKLNGQEMLTTQFYFSQSAGDSGDALFPKDPGEAQALVIDLSDGVDANGNAILVGHRDIVLSSAVSNN